MRSNGCPVLTTRCISLTMMATEELKRCWYSCFFAVLVCCSVGISCNDINLKVTHLLKHCFEKFSNSSRRIHCPLVVEMACTASLSRKTTSGLMHLAAGLKGSPAVPRSLPSTANATGSRSAKSCSADRSRDSGTALSDVLPNLTSKIAACPFLSFSDSHQRRIYPEELILAWTDRSLLLLE